MWMNLNPIFKRLGKGNFSLRETPYSRRDMSPLVPNAGMLIVLAVIIIIIKECLS